MSNGIYVVYDNKAMVFSTRLLVYVADGAATREFSDVVNTPDSPYFNHPEDYELVRIGEFDQHSGAIDSEHHQTVMTGRQARADAIKNAREQKDLLDAARSTEELAAFKQLAQE